MARRKKNLFDLKVRFNDIVMRELGLDITEDDNNYLYNIDGGGGMHYILVSPDGVPLKDLGFVSDYKEKPTPTTIEKDGEEPGLQ